VTSTALTADPPRLTRAEFKSEYQAGLQDLAAAVTNRYAEAVLTTEDIAELRRAMEFLRDTLALGEEKKADPNAGLPTFNITINGGSVQMTPTLQNAEEVPHTLEFTPTPAMLENLGINADLDETILPC